EQVDCPEPPVSLQPTVQFAQGLGIEPIYAIAAFALFLHQMRLVQNTQVFRDGWPAYLEAAGDLVNGEPAIAQPIEDGAAGGIGDGLKDVRFLRNHSVTS